MWRTEVTRLIYWLLKLFQLKVFFLFVCFVLLKLKSEQVRHRYHIRWGGADWCGDSVDKCQLALAAPRTVPNIPNKAEKRLGERN